jgi:hypothetical protein
MQHRSYPTRPPTPTPPTVQPFALHLLHGWWIASCPDCGHALGRSRDQETAERAGERRRCPICRPDHPQPPIGPIRAGQRIRFATVDGTTHTVTVARIQVRELHLCTTEGGCFVFEADAGEPF